MVDQELHPMWKVLGLVMVGSNPGYLQFSIISMSLLLKEVVASLNPRPSTRRRKRHKDILRLDPRSYLKRELLNLLLGKLKIPSPYSTIKPKSSDLLFVEKPLNGLRVLILSRMRRICRLNSQ